MADERSIDRKLHRIVIATQAGLTTAAALARHLTSGNHHEFTYTRDDKTHFCSWESIRRYVTFSNEIGFLDDSYQCVGVKRQLRAYGNFQSWAGNLLLLYNDNNGLSIQTLQQKVGALVETKRQVPTTDRLYDELPASKPSKQTFIWALNLQAILRPATLTLCRQWLWLPENTYSV